MDEDDLEDDDEDLDDEDLDDEDLDDDEEDIKVERGPKTFEKANDELISKSY